VPICQPQVLLTWCRDVSCCPPLSPQNHPRPLTHTAAHVHHQPCAVCASAAAGGVAHAGGDHTAGERQGGLGCNNVEGDRSEAEGSSKAGRGYAGHRLPLKNWSQGLSCQVVCLGLEQSAGERGRGGGEAGREGPDSIRTGQGVAHYRANGMQHVRSPRAQQHQCITATDQRAAG